jgi:dolichol-phosphate mannosyltransferase
MTPDTAGPRQGPDAPPSDGQPILSVIIPTRNEAANARPLVEQLAAVLAGVAAEVIFVDDSDDETPGLLREAAGSTALSLAVIHRPHGQRYGGLSTAVLEGMRAASGDYILIMDADLQHPPHLIHALLETARSSNADIVIASRYIPGGSDGGLAGPSRKAISWGARTLVKALFPRQLRGVTDPLSGFFLARRDLVTAASLRPVGFKILLDILVRCPRPRLREVPLQFAARAGGVSKATFAQGRTFLAHVWLLVQDAYLNGSIRRQHRAAAREESADAR